MDNDADKDDADNNANKDDADRDDNDDDDDKENEGIQGMAAMTSIDPNSDNKGYKERWR